MSVVTAPQPQGMRSFSVSQYADWPAEYERYFTSEQKAEQRSRVVAHILKHHQKRTPMRFFSLPGLYWAAENLMTDRLKLDHCQFLGVERAWGVVAKSLPYMPGDRPFWYEEKMANGTIQCAATTNSRIAIFDLADFVTMEKKYRRGKKHNRHWYTQWKRWSCCWIDGWSCVGGQYLPVLTQMEMSMDPEVVSVPIGITFLIGRDDDPSVYAGLEHIKDGLQKRVQAITKILSTRRYRTFVLDDAWSYSNRRGAAIMGSVIGRMVLRENVNPFEVEKF